MSRDLGNINVLRMKIKEYSEGEINERWSKLL